MTLLADDRDARGRGGSGAHPSAGTGTDRTRSCTDAELIEAVRAGESSAYAALYGLHHAAVQRLARRLTRDPHEADDVVSEVFANTLRAIRNGGGPDDDFAAYALRSVRNTIVKLRTRTDTARATPTVDAELDAPDASDPYPLAGDIEQAFTELPERFRDVLWSTAVEGHTAAELSARSGDIDAGAAASLTLRARKALGRSYLRVRTHRPVRDAECGRVRSYLPGYVQHSAAAGTVTRVETHLQHCADCAEVRDEMYELNGKLRTTPWLALLAASVRRVAMSVAGSAGPAAVTAAAPILAVAAAGTLIVRHEATEHARRDATPAFAAAEVLPQPPASDPLAGAAGRPDDATGGPAEPGDTTVDDELGTDAPETTGTDTDGTNDSDTDDTPDTDTGTGTGTDGPRGGGNGTGSIETPDVDPVDAGTAAGTTGGGEAASGSGDPDGAGGVTVGGVTVGGVVGGVIDDATGDVIPVVTGTTGDLLDDVGATVDDVVGVVGALPNGLPAVGEAAGELLGGVGDTLDNTVGNLGSTVDTVVDTVGGAVGGTVTVVDGAVAGTVGTVGDSVGDIVDVDADDPVGDLVDDLLGDDGLVDGLIGDGGVVGGLVGGLIGGGAGGSGGAVCIPLPLLPCP